MDNNGGTMRITEIKRVEKSHTAERNRRGGHRPSVIYVWVKDEGVLENLMNRKSRPHTLYKKLLTPVLAELGVPEGARLAWNQRAGCKCPCSPGFNVRNRTNNVPLYLTNPTTYVPYDVHVTIEA